MKSIRMRLILYFSLILAAATSVLGFINLQGAENAVADEAEEGLYALAEEGAKVTESRLDSEFVYLEGLANFPEAGSREPDVDRAMTIFMNEVEQTDYLRIGIADLNGNLYLTDSYGIDGDIVDISEREYYQASLEGERGLMPPSPSVNPDDGDRLIMVTSVPVMNDGEVTGVIVAVGDADFLNLIVDDIQYGQSGYAYMIDETGTVIAHQNREMVMNAFNPIQEAAEDQGLNPVAGMFTRMLDEESGVGSYEFQGDELYLGFSEVGDTGWNLVIAAQEDEVLSAIPVLRNTALLFTGLVILISIGLTYVVGTRLSKPIQAISVTAEQVGNLDVTQDVDPVLAARKDEVGRLARSLQSVTENIRKVINDINDSANSVSSASEELTATSNESSIATEEVASTIQDIAEGASIRQPRP